ncbi:MAG: hypothetical protein Q9181_006660 [Wetmoreana brouardii]
MVCPRIILYIVFEFLIYILHSLALTLPPSAIISNAGSEASNATSLHALNVKCDAPRYGDGLEFKNCINAWAKITPDVTPRRYTQRPERYGEIGLPLRYLSGKLRDLTSPLAFQAPAV